jgi:hypothetical protein
MTLCFPFSHRAVEMLQTTRGRSVSTMHPDFQSLQKRIA